MKDEGGGREEGADTELKTKTPHVNVGKKNQSRERVRRKKVQVREKLLNTAFFPMFCGSGDGGSKSPPTPLWR